MQGETWTVPNMSPQRVGSETFRTVPSVSLRVSSLENEEEFPMDVLRETLRISGVSMATIFVMMAGLYAVIKILMNGEHNRE